MHVEWHCNDTNEIFSTPKIKNLLSFLSTSQFLNWSRCCTGVDFAPPWSLLGQSCGARRDCVMTHSFAYVIQIRHRSESPQPPPTGIDSHCVFDTSLDVGNYNNKPLKIKSSVVHHHKVNNDCDEWWSCQQQLVLCKHY